MRMNTLPNVKTLTNYFRLNGGLDIVSPPLAIDAGKCISAMNYECNSLGGYRRIDGYERFDGRVSPSDQVYCYCLCTFVDVVNIGDTIVGITSAATGKVLSVTATELIITRVTGTFTVEEFKVGTVVKGTFTYVPLSNGHPTGLGHATALGLTADDYRTDILPVTGSGVIRGVCMIKGVAYAFRNNAAGTEVDIYRSTSTGWQKITLFKSLPFKNCIQDVIDAVNINQKQNSVNAGSFVVGTQYTIDTVGSTLFTAIGAATNTVGTIFIATGAGAGTGTALVTASATVKRQVIESSYVAADLDSGSFTSMTMATGSKLFTIDKDKAYIAGDNIVITSVANALNYMVGVVVSYNDTQLTVNVTSIVGSGTFSNWALHSERVSFQSDSGRFIITNIIGTFSNTASYKIYVGSFAIADVDSTDTNPVSDITIMSGGNYQFVLNNFFANVDAKKVYGTDSLNRAFEFDGDVYIPIRTKIALDAPTQIAVVNDQLVLSYFGQLLFSAVGNPHDFRTTSLGFADLGVGDTITGLAPQLGGGLAVFCRDSCFQVSLDTQANAYASKLISSDFGAIHYGLLNLGGLYSFDDKGITKVVPSYNFGGFEHDTVSRAVQPIIEAFRDKIVATAVFRGKNQCRFYATDGSGICMTMAKNAQGVVEHYFSEFQYPITVSYAWSGEDASGRDIILLGDSNGYVYIVGKGSSFDGQPITAYLRTAFNNLKSPSAIKRFRKMEIEMSAAGYSEIRINPDFSYADSNVATHIMRTESVSGAGGYWDESTFNSFYYDGKIVSQPEFRIFGSGINIGLVVYSKSSIDLGHTLSGVILHYTPRKLNR